MPGQWFYLEYQYQRCSYFWRQGMSLLLVVAVEAGSYWFVERIDELLWLRAICHTYLSGLFTGAYRIQNMRANCHSKILSGDVKYPYSWGWAGYLTVVLQVSWWGYEDKREDYNLCSMAKFSESLHFYIVMIEGNLSQITLNHTWSKRINCCFFNLLCRCSLSQFESHELQWS